MGTSFQNCKYSHSDCSGTVASSLDSAKSLCSSGKDWRQDHNDGNPSRSGNQHLQNNAWDIHHDEDIWPPCTLPSCRLLCRLCNPCSMSSLCMCCPWHYKLVCSDRACNRCQIRNRKCNDSLSRSRQYYSHSCGGSQLHTGAPHCRAFQEHSRVSSGTLRMILASHCKRSSILDSLRWFRT